MNETALCSRLLSAVKYVRRGAVFADIGTDHAYLPIYLLKEGIVARAILADINEGPLASARENAKAAGVLDRVKLVLTDGASELSCEGITDVAIFGMGGELIADIIERAPFLRDPNIRLILQPMTKQAHLCEYLLSHGFGIVGETYTTDSGKFYRTVAASFGGGSEVQGSFAEIGLSTTPCEEIESKTGYLRTRLSSYERQRSGKRSASLDTAAEDALIKLINRELLRLGEGCDNDC